MSRLHRLSTVLSLLAVLAGIGVFVWLFTQTDVLATLRSLPPALLLLVPWAAVPAWVATVSWARSFPRLEGSEVPPMTRLFTIRLAGEAVNNGLASAYVAGEPVKGLFAARYGATPTAGLASALTGKTTSVFGEVLFLLTGVAVAWFTFGAASELVTLLLTVALIGLAVVAVGVFVQRKRAIGRGARVLKLLRLGPRSLWDRALPGADALDAAVHGYYERQRGDFFASTLWSAAAWLLGAFEVYVFLLVATDVPDPLATAVVIEAGIAVVKGLSFFVPASVGAQEGGIAWLFHVTGAGTEAGVAYAVFRRFREVVWIALGFHALGRYLKTRPPPDAAAEGRAPAV